MLQAERVTEFVTDHVASPSIAIRASERRIENNGCRFDVCTDAAGGRHADGRRGQLGLPDSDALRAMRAGLRGVAEIDGVVLFPPFRSSVDRPQWRSVLLLDAGCRIVDVDDVSGHEMELVAAFAVAVPPIPINDDASTEAKMADKTTVLYMQSL
jgi:hypothetical protein